MSKSINIQNMRDQKLEEGNTKLPPTKEQKYRRWCFTSFIEEELQPRDYEYVIIGEEIAPTTGQKHWQGYIRFANPVIMTTAQKRIGDLKCHLERCKGSEESNIKYCSKDTNVVFEDGETTNQGKRTDLSSTVDDILGGVITTEEQLMEQRGPAYCRNRNGLLAILNAKMIQRDWEMEIIIIQGESGIGKTSYAHQQWPNAYWKSNDMWWDHYTGQETVIWDEFKYEHIKIADWLRLTDSKPYIVQNKGGTTHFRSKRIVFTAIKPWEDWWGLNDEEGFNKDTEFDQVQVERRITEVIKLKKETKNKTRKPIIKNICL